jgi:DNA-binding NarL/FixJ family response regulator
MSPDIARKGVVALQRQRWIDKPEEALTPHEMRIRGMLADGDSYQDVGDRLGITVNTVRNSFRRTYESSTSIPNPRPSARSFAAG